MLHSKFQNLSGRKETAYVAPTSKCLQIINDDNLVSIASGNSIQLVQVNIVTTSTAAEDQQQQQKLQVKTAGDLCLQIFDNNNKSRISSTALLSPSSILTAATSSSSSDVSLSVVNIDTDAMKNVLVGDQDRRRQREEDKSSSNVLKLKTSFNVAGGDSSSSSPFLSGSGGGSNYIGLDSLSSSASSSEQTQIFLTNGLSRTSSVIDLETQKSVATFSHHDNFVISSCSLPNFVSSSSSSDNIIAVNTGNFITLWDARQATAINSNSSPNRSPLYPNESSITCMTPFASSSPSNSNTNHLLLTGAADRSVTLWDMRKWTKQHVAQSTLKFAPASIAATTRSSSSSGSTAVNIETMNSGNFITVSGSDSEVRNLWIPYDANAPNVAGGNNNKKGGKATKEQEAENFNGATGGTFRQRLQDATHCATSWYGSWVSSSSSSNFTLGMSRDYELFLAKF